MREWKRKWALLVGVYGLGSCVGPGGLGFNR